jgi:hypothetical protein
MPLIDVRLDHPENRAVLNRLKQHWDGSRPQNLSAAPAVYDLYRNSLGTHPDLLDYFWTTLAAKLPEPCAWVVYGNPVLIHPTTGIIFGFAGGTHLCALRLPEDARRKALLAGAKKVHRFSTGAQLSLDEIGEEWVFGGWLDREPDWCLAAFQHAGSFLNECALHSKLPA